MGTSYSTLLASPHLRFNIRETSASTWTDAELAYPLSTAEQWLAQFLSQIKGSGRFIVEETATLAADAETITQASLAKGDGSAGEFTGLRWINMLVNNNSWEPCYPMEEGDENLYRLPNTAIPVGSTPYYEVLDTNLRFLPISSAARSLRIRYSWIPVRKTKAGTAETPTQYDDILCLRAAFDALAPLGQSEGQFEQKYGMRLSEIEDFEFNRARKGVSHVVKNVSARDMFPLI